MKSVGEEMLVRSNQCPLVAANNIKIASTEKSHKKLPRGVVGESKKLPRVVGENVTFCVTWRQKTPLLRH